MKHLNLTPPCKVGNKENCVKTRGIRTVLNCPSESRLSNRALAGARRLWHHVFGRTFIMFVFLIRQVI